MIEVQYRSKDWQSTTAVQAHAKVAAHAVDAMQKLGDAHDACHTADAFLQTVAATDSNVEGKFAQRVLDACRNVGTAAPARLAALSAAMKVLATGVGGSLSAALIACANDAVHMLPYSREKRDTEGYLTNGFLGEIQETALVEQKPAVAEMAWVGRKIGPQVMINHDDVDGLRFPIQANCLWHLQGGECTPASIAAVGHTAAQLVNGRSSAPDATARAARVGAIFTQALLQGITYDHELAQVLDRVDNSKNTRQQEFEEQLKSLYTFTKG